MKFSGRNRASSLVVTLLVLVVLSTIVVAFMQSMSVERMTAKSAKNLLQAQLAAESGVNAAKSRVVELFSRYPDSATVWQRFATGLTNEGTVFYFRAAPATISETSLPASVSPAAFNPTPGTPANVQTYAWPLISGAAPVVATNLTNSFATPLNTSNSTDLNLRNWIGTAPGGSKKSLRAQWVYLTNSSGETNARYAFWVEDESFKVNLSVATNSVRGSSSKGRSAEEVPLQGILGYATGIATNDSSANALASLRTDLGGTDLLSYRTASQAFAPGGTNAVADQLKFIATADSSALNLSRGGWRRVNINTIFRDGSPPRTQLNRFIATVTNAQAAPLFGQRFYRASYSSLNLGVTNTVTATNALIYLNKLAANVKDYVDEDNQPTLVDYNFSVVGNAVPAEAIEPLGGGTTGQNPIIAFGKENVPMLHEYAIQGRILYMNPRGWSGSNPGGASFSVSVDHYFEFWNMGHTDITADDLGPNAFLMIYNQMEAQMVTPEIAEGRPIKIMLSDINNLVFRAGQVTVITTDPAPNPNLLASGANVFIAPVGTAERVFDGTTTDSFSNPVYDSANAKIYNNSFRVRFVPRSNSYNDYETCMFLGNDNGLLESFCALPIVRSSSYAMDLVADRVAKINSNLYFTRGGSLYGNGSASSSAATPSSGDPRSLNEQLTLNIFQSGGPADEQTRFFWSNLDDNAVPANSSLGALNSNFVEPNYWPDYSVNSTGSTNAPAKIANAPMETIGELGHIYDPARVSSTSYRGGGRTLRVGQPELWSVATNASGLWDGRRDSSTRTWAAWRLADLFDTRTNDVLKGSINVNGAARDGGLALKSALKGFIFEPDTPSVGNHASTDVQLNTLIGAITNRLAIPLNTTNSPFFWERGEVSELGVFQSGTGLTGVNMAQVLDRGREETVRRLINLITTKGNVYSAYVVGQAISVANNGSVKVLSTSRVRQIFAVNSPDIINQVDSFDPSNAAAMSARFQPLTNFSSTPLWKSFE